MKHVVTKICLMLLVAVFASSTVFAQKSMNVESLSKAELSMMQKVTQVSPHPDYQAPDNITAVPITVFPYSQDFEGGWPAEFEDVSGADADAYVDASYPYSGNSLFLEGNTSTNYGSTPSTYALAFDASKSTHFATVDIDVVPSGSSGVLTMEFMMAQGYSFNTNYSWFRVLGDGAAIFDDQGAYYWQPAAHYTGPSDYSQKTFDLSALAGAPFTISLQASVKYYMDYYNEGDWTGIDDFTIYYMLDPGDLEGYVFNGAGLTIAGATVGVEGQGVATTDPTGYYYLAGIMGGDQVAYAWKQGYNQTTENVYIPPAGLGYQDFILNAPTMFISPTAHNRTMNPNEYTSQPYTGILNTGDGILHWEAEVQYPVTDIAVTKEGARTNVAPATDASPTVRQIQITNPMRNTWDVQFNFPTAVGGGEAGAESDGQFIFSTKWNGSDFYKYALDGTYIETFTCGSANSIRDLAYVSSTGYFYGGAASSTVYIMDFYSQTTVGTVTSPNAVRAIGYNDDNDSFYSNNWSDNIVEWDRATGATIGSFAVGAFSSYYGFAYDNWTDGGPYLWGFSQDGSGGVLVQMQLPGGAETGFTVDVLPLVGGTQIAGGLFTQGGIVPGFVTIGGMLQNELIFGLELAEGGSTGSWLTLDWYEGDVLPNGGLDNIPTNFDASGTAAGEVYTADLVFTSTPDVGTITIPCTMTILGDPLVPPSNLEVTLTDDINGITYLTWDWTTDAFQYFVVKRDGVVVGSTTDQFFTDYLPDYGTYCYTVQAIYDEGQTAPAGPECIEWPNPELNIVSALPLEQWMWPDTQSGIEFTFENAGTGTMTFEFPDYVTDFVANMEVVMYDDYGDGWNGGTLDLFVNGAPVLTGVTLSGGAGPETIPFTAEIGDEITSTFTCGSWCYECSYEIVDGFGNVIYTDGAGGVDPTGIPAGTVFADGPVPSYIVDVIPASGVVPEGGTQSVDVIYNSTGFPAGDFPEDLTMNTNDPNNLELFIPNIMHVYIPGNLVGTVTDCNTGAPIAGVTVTAGAWQGLTAPDGTYDFFVDAGTYDVMFEKLGYQSHTELGVVVPAGVPTVVDASLCEEAYAPAWVTATVNDPDTECLVEWALPIGPYEILYDDGSAEELVVWASANNENAVKFTPLGYPATIVGGRLFVGDGNFPAGDWFGSEFAILVYDDDGTNGMPGTVLDSLPVVVTNYGWISFWGLNATITDGDFYLSMMQLQPSPAAPLGVDYTPPTVFRSYSRFAGAEWALSVYQDFMMRAFVEGPVTDVITDGTQTMVAPKLPKGMMGKEFFAMNNSTPQLTPGVVKGGEIKIVDNAPQTDVLETYEVARVDNFDPNAGPQTGTLTTIASGVTTTDYNDVAWGGLPQGWYAYAVRAAYTNGDLSPWTYSNVVGHLMDFEVTFEVTMCDGSDPDGIEILMSGEEYPYNTYFAVTDVTGIVVFDSVIMGNYTISASGIGLETYTFQDNIIADITYPITMCEKRYPPKNLWVDPLTSWAHWDWPVVEALDEDFEDATFPPAGWQATSLGEGWYRTDDGNGGAWVIPAWDSFYALSNDDNAPSNNDGSADYLITPGLDLRESDDFGLYFDSFFDAAYGQSAYIEYSYDAGATWEVLYAMPPTPGAWAYTEVDLSSLSGLTAQSPVWLAFHSDDNGAWASGWAVDNIFVANGLADPIDFYVFLDGAFVAPTDTNMYQYVYLTYGVTYEASVAARYCCGLSEKAYYTFTSEYLIPPQNLDGETFDDAVHIWWNPPTTPGTFDLISEEPRTVTPDPNADYSPMVRTVNATNPEGSRDMWDVLFNFPTAINTGEAGVETDGNYIYVSNWQNGEFYKYGLDGTYIETFSCGSASAIRDLAFNPSTGFFYGGAAATTVFEMDFNSQTVVSTINAPVACRAIAYDEDADGFWANNWSDNITLFDMSGAMVTSFPVGAFGSYYGFAYDDWADGGPYLWGHSQDGSGAVLVQMEIASGTEVFNLDVLPIVGGTQIAGGLFTHCNLFGNNKVTIGGMLQNELIYGLEYESCSGGGGPTPGVVPDNLLGYNVYRDLGVIAYVPYNGEDTSHYYDTDLEPLTYQYDVSALYDLTPYGFPGDTGESALEGPFIIDVMYGHPLPFNEEWNSGSFDVNFWQHEGNWRVNGQIGDPEPASEFTWDPIVSDYRQALTSFPIDGYNVVDPFIDGNIWFDYTVRFDGQNSTGTEFLKVEVGTQGNWQTIAVYDNANGSFDWTSYHHDITGIAFGEIFRVRFVAEGTNSVDILSWFVDNINIYRTCAAPRNLTADQQNCVDIYLNWNAPATGGGGGGGGEWLHWDDGINVDGIGLTGGGVFSVASHWDPDMLTAYQGTSITKIRFYVYDNVVASAYTVQVWTGANGANLVYEEAVTGTVAGSWFEHTLSAPVAIDASQELWFGYTVDQPDGENPAGCDAGPATVGYGDMINLGGWEPIANYGFDLNWNLQAWVESTDGEAVALEPRVDNTVRTDGELNIDYGTPSAAPSYNHGSRELQGYNIYVNNDFLDFTEDTTYLHTVTENNTYTYEVTAVYEDCESDTAAGPVSVDVLCVGIDELGVDGIAVYPNPAKDVLNIESAQDITFVTILNNVGQVVYNNKVVNDNVLTVNTSSFEAGVYMVKIESNENIIIKKIVIAQ